MSLKNVPLLFFLGASRLLYLVRTPLLSICLFIYTIFFLFLFLYFYLLGFFFFDENNGFFLVFFSVLMQEKVWETQNIDSLAPTPFCFFFTLFTYQIVDIYIYVCVCVCVLNMHTNIVIVLQLERQGEVWEREIERFFEGESEGHTCNCLMSACSTPCPHADKHNHCIFI